MILVALADGCLAPVRTLLERGHAMTAPIATALGRDEGLARLLAHATAPERQEAFALAVINRRVHKHSTPLHQAAVNDDVAMLELLVARGASLTTRDTLWNGTPLGWAEHTRKRAAERFLRALTPDAAGAHA